MFVPVKATVPPVASTERLPEPVMLPLSTGVRALSVSVLLPVVVNRCKV